MIFLCSFVSPCSRKLEERNDLITRTVGGYSLLQAGPAAFNLVATREGSERVVHGMGENFNIFKDERAKATEWSREELHAHGGLFNCLAVE